MKLYILRHGHSPSIEETKVSSDAERPLSERGKADVRKSVAYLIRQGGKPSLILHSPLKRAVQTAREASALIPSAELKSFLPLDNTMSPLDLSKRLNYVATHTDDLSELLIVGHQPQLGELAAYLSKCAFPFPTAGILAMELKDKDAAMPLWSCNPEDLRE